MASPVTDDVRLRPMSLADWAELPEDDAGEIVDGYLVEEEGPDFLHELVVAWLIRALANWALPRGGLVGGSEAKLAVGEGRGRKADIVLYLPGRQPPARGLIQVPPDLVVEVVSSRPRDHRQDRVEKLAEYASFGVRWYWLVDPEARTLEVLELGADSRYVHALSATAGVVAGVPGAADLSLDLDDLWRAVDRLLAGNEPA